MKPGPARRTCQRCLNEVLTKSGWGNGEGATRHHQKNNFLGTFFSPPAYMFMELVFLCSASRNSCRLQCEPAFFFYDGLCCGNAET